MEINSMLNQQGAWLRGTGPEADIVISSRIRLARNIDGFPFVNRATPQDLENILAQFQTMSKKIFDESSIYFLDLRELSETDRHYLLERQLISKELADGDGPRAVIIDRNEDYSIMVNEEDHLRLQAMTSGFDPDLVWDRINAIDDKIANELPIAFDERLGYLTACPSNTGTGIRVSVMLHLPGLVETEEVERVFRGLQKMNLAVRGIYGEGSSALGEFFQLSNQITLGKSEEELITQVADVIPLVIEYERRARAHLIETTKDTILDKCFRALGVLRTARTISVEESMELLSRTRMGVTLGLIDEIDCSLINDLLLHLQPSHLQKLAGKEMDEIEAGIWRATYIRDKINEKK